MMNPSTLHDFMQTFFHAKTRRRKGAGDWEAVVTGWPARHAGAQTMGGLIIRLRRPLLCISASLRLCVRFRRYNYRLIFPLMLLATFATAADPDLKPVADPGPILQDLQHKMASLDSVCFDFTQERHLKLFTEPLKSEGMMLIQRPDRIRWETTAPYQSIMIGNYKSVAQWERNDGKWEKLHIGFPQMLKRVMEQMTLMHQGKLDVLASDFTISVATGSVAVVTMVPRDPNVRQYLSALEIHFAPDFSASREVCMREPSGDYTRIIFDRERRNVKYPPGTFDQAKPLDIADVKAALGQ